MTDLEREVKLFMLRMEYAAGLVSTGDYEIAVKELTEDEEKSDGTD